MPATIGSGTGMTWPTPTPARGGHVVDDSVTVAGGAVLSRAFLRATQPATPREFAGIGGWPEVARRVAVPGEWRLRPVRRTTILATRRPAGPCGGRTPPRTPPCRWHCRAA